MATIKVTDDRQGRTFRLGVNGKQFDLPVNQETEVEDSILENLRDLGVTFEEVDTKGAGSSKEGSGDGLAPIGPHDVQFPGTETKSADASSGDQPGDVVSNGDVQFASAEGQSIEDAARISDIRVAAERGAPTDGSVSVAELAGEGEQGTKAVEPASPKKPAARKASK